MMPVVDGSRCRSDGGVCDGDDADAADNGVARSAPSPSAASSVDYGDQYHAYPMMRCKEVSLTLAHAQNEQGDCHDCHDCHDYCHDCTPDSSPVHLQQSGDEEVDVQDMRSFSTASDSDEAVVVLPQANGDGLAPQQTTLQFQPPAPPRRRVSSSPLLSSSPSSSSSMMYFTSSFSTSPPSATHQSVVSGPNSDSEMDLNRSFSETEMPSSPSCPSSPVREAACTMNNDINSGGTTTVDAGTKRSMEELMTSVRVPPSSPGPMVGMDVDPPPLGDFGALGEWHADQQLCQLQDEHGIDCLRSQTVVQQARNKVYRHKQRKRHLRRQDLLQGQQHQQWQYEDPDELEKILDATPATMSFHTVLCCVRRLHCNSDAQHGMSSFCDRCLNPATLCVSTSAFKKLTQILKQRRQPALRVALQRARRRKQDRIAKAKKHEQFNKTLHNLRATNVQYRAKLAHLLDVYNALARMLVEVAGPC